MADNRRLTLEDYLNEPPRKNTIRVKRPVGFKSGGAVTTRSLAKRAKLDENVPPASTEGQPAQQSLSEDGDNVTEEVQPQEEELSPQAEADTEVPSTSDGVEAAPVVDSTVPKLKTSTDTYNDDTIVVENDLITAHIFRAFHRHQKIFQ